MKSVTKQSHKVGGVLTREVHLGVDGSLSVYLNDQVTLIDQKGGSISFPAEKLMTLFAECPYKNAITTV